MGPTVNLQTNHSSSYLCVFHVTLILHLIHQFICVIGTLLHILLWWGAVKPTKANNIQILPYLRSCYLEALATKPWHQIWPWVSGKFILVELVVHRSNRLSVMQRNSDVCGNSTHVFFQFCCHSGNICMWIYYYYYH